MVILAGNDLIVAKSSSRHVVPLKATRIDFAANDAVRIRRKLFHSPLLATLLLVFTIVHGIPPFHKMIR
jgi:hypothetical protein